MEREMERLREPEPFEAGVELKARLDWVEAQKKRRLALPRVVKYAEAPFHKSRDGFTKMLLNMPHWWLFDQRNGPIYTMAVMEQVRQPGGHGGKHRHLSEALFYIVEGKGWEIHDNVKYEWEEGDIMAIPIHCVHQHFGHPEHSTRMLAVIPIMLDFMGLGKREQLEYEPQAGEIPDEAKALLSIDEAYDAMMRARTAITLDQLGEVKTTYDQYLQLLAEENEWRLKVPHVLKGRDIPWEHTRQGKMKFLLHSKTAREAIGLRLFDAFVQEIPPGGWSGKHRHIDEEVLKILDGRGYDVHDGVRYDWEREDLVCIPIHTVHQHFNADPQRPARFLSIRTRFATFMGYGGIEHLEDAPGQSL